MSKSKTLPPFRFKQFSVAHDRCAMPVGTDGVLLGAWSAIEAATNALDIGTGSGLIALILAQRAPGLRVDAVEIDPISFEQAKDNILQSPFHNRVQVHQMAIQEFARQTSQKYDLIVCNPPFFSGGALSLNQRRNQVRHTLKLSHNELLEACQQLLSIKGTFNLILPLAEGLHFLAFATPYGFYLQRLTEVQDRPGSKVVRLLLSFSRQSSKIQKESLILKNSDGRTRSDSHQQLVDDFYL